jgi:hypothetical protein
MTKLAWYLALLGVAGACGDNSNQCGEGTELRDGVCVGIPPMCTDGTILDEHTNACVLDPTACQDGTVLIDGACKDPATEVTVDVAEAAEPNALGVGGEASDAPAGELTLPAPGGAPIVIKGTITPRADADEDGAQEPDFDTYLFAAPGPTLLEVSVDGLGGLAGGFVALADVNGLESWLRIGVNTTGDTTKRQLFLPAAGTYALAIADTRTLMSGTADGGPNATYYATVKVLPLPAPTPITVANGLGTATGTVAAHETKFFTAPLGNGLNEVRAITYQRDVIGALVVNVNEVPVALAVEEKGANDFEASYVIGGVDATDETLIVLDQQINTANGTSPFRIDVQTRTATALSTSGGTVSATQRIEAGAQPQNLDELNAFYFDANAGQSVGLDLQWSVPVDGLVFHERGGIAGVFSWDPFFGSLFGFPEGFGLYTWSSYKGVFRAPQAGRYYIVVNAPEESPGAQVSVTSTIAATPPAQLAFGAPGVTTPAHTTFNSVPFEYLGSTERWQAFTVDADPASGGATLDVFDPAHAFGTLDPVGLTGDWGNGPGETLPVMVDTQPLYSVSASADASASVGRLMPGTTQRHYVKVRTTSGTGTVGVRVTARDYTDEGVHAGPYTVTHADEQVGADGAHRYLLRTAPGSTVTVSVTPTAQRDLGVRRVGEDEMPADDINDAGLGEAEELVVKVDGDGRVAVEVYDAGLTPGTGTFAITFDVVAPPPPFYAVTSGTTAWSNACISGTEVTPLDYDDGLTSAITLPAGFTFFGEPVTALRVSANGWLTFDTTSAIGIGESRSPQGFPSDLPPQNVVTPLWVDMTNVRICTRTIGTKLVVQWRGDLFGSNILVATQAILDSADDTIELVYAPFIEASGDPGAAGVENADGTRGQLLFFNSRSVQPGTSIKLTP